MQFFFFFVIELSPHATPIHFHFSTLSFYEIVCKFSIPCHKFPTPFVEKLLLLRQFDNCNDNSCIKMVTKVGTKLGRVVQFDRGEKWAK